MPNAGLVRFAGGGVFFPATATGAFDAEFPESLDDAVFQGAQIARDLLRSASPPGFFQIPKGLNDHLAGTVVG
ncbi:MAG TPA: hypothetical protein PL182_14075, partial [Pseudobdellovibrionaceae bacterium]|nr:hypothetical protein [Pseudobdellovibrionaceae bacterium]